MYMVLARKYRPQTFLEVVGQEAIVQTLCKALDTGRLAHAFLFTGSRGTGKTTLARLLAKALVCEKGVSSNPCNLCANCKAVLEGNSLDVLEIDGASNTSVDHIRDLRDSIRYQPAHARFKVIIIDEVHMLSTSAFNALLKTLEEPPSYVKFIFATTEPHKILPTILSRCQRYDFKRLSVEQIISNLESVTQKEGFQLARPVLSLIAKAAQGGLRDAQSLTDQVLSFSTAEPSLQEVAQLLGILESSWVHELLVALLKRDLLAALKILQQVYERGHDLKRLLEQLAFWAKELAITATLKQPLIDEARTQEEEVWLQTHASLFDPLDLNQVFEILLEGVEKMARVEEPLLAFELCLLKGVHRPSLLELSAIEKAILQLENLEKGSSVPPKEHPRLEARFEQFVKAIAQKQPALGHHLEHGVFQATQKPHVYCLQFQHKVHHQAVLEAQTQPLWQAVVEQVYSKQTQIQVELKTAPALDSSRPSGMTLYQAQEENQKKAQAFLEARAKADPLVQRALSLFGGEIKNVAPIVRQPSNAPKR